ncbi:MAG TPA: SDR family oxidoreductase [Alphaproteobacteria bacterium]|nr:SDR family oxidoreductase [Alphaproteobacteria bacterium]
MSDFVLPAELPRAALVTGAARRIGRAIALDLSRAGLAVAIHYRTSQSDAEALAAEIAAGGGKAAALGANLAREAESTILVSRANAALGPLGVLVNNASLFERDEALSATRASWDAHFETNLRAPFVLSQAFARQLPSGREGLIVNLVDERVWNLTPHFTSYSLSKAGLWALTQTLALALAPRIRVNAIGPGPVLPSPRQSESQFTRQVAGVPLGRSATVDEIAATVRFLASQRSITGQMIALDGGQHLNWASPGRDAAPEE